MPVSHLLVLYSETHILSSNLRSCQSALMHYRTDEHQPLLGPSHAPGQEASSSRTGQQGTPDEERQLHFNRNAQKLVKWTIWLLLGAVLIGTILGVVLVSIPMQNSTDPPGPSFQLCPPGILSLSVLVLLHQATKAKD